MNNLEFTLLLSGGSLIAGLLGALTGLGGGVVIIPLLTLGFGVDIRYAIGASLISVISTSSGAAAAYVREGFTNIRIGMFLEVATTVGAVVGAMLQTTAAQFAEQVKKGLREVRLTVSWPESGRDESFQVKTHMLVLAPGELAPR